MKTVGSKIAMMISMLIILLLVESTNVSAAQFDGGTGSAGDPYIITSAVQLNEIRNYTSKHFVLRADIDLSESSYSEGWTPIGTFSGKLSGEGHSIFGLRIIGTGQSMGLFSSIAYSGRIEDLNLINGSVSNQGYSITGALAGRNEGVISNVKVINSMITGSAFTGSIAGTNDGNIIGSQVIGGSVTGGQTVGGMLGQNSGAFSNNRVVDTAVSGATEVGGVVGSNQAAGVMNKVSYVSGSELLFSSSSGLGGLASVNYGLISESYTMGIIGNGQSAVSAGGLVYYNTGTIENSYAKADVRGMGTMGGLVALQSDSGYLIRSYASGTTPTNSGGLIGQADGTVVDSYWNTSTGVGTGYASGSAAGSGATGFSATDMMKQSSYVAWDNFQEIWEITENETTPSFIEYLEDLEVRIGDDTSVSPIAFDPEQYKYILNVPHENESVRVTAVKRSVTDSVYINYDEVLDSTIVLTGSKTIIPVSVHRGSRTVEYTITINRLTAEPTGSFIIVGNATHVNTTIVNLSIARNELDVVHMRFSNDGQAWSDWEAFADSKLHTISSGDGLKTIYMELRNSSGRVNSSMIINVVTLDTVAPEPPEFTLSTLAPAQAVTVTIEYPADTVDKRYQLWGENSSNYTGPFVLTQNRTISAYATDAAGNMRESTLTITNINPEAPGPSVVINNGALWTNNSEVMLTLDDGGIGATMMRLSSDNETWSNWEDYSASKIYQLPEGDGEKWVYVMLRDTQGNDGESIAASIVLDTVAPVITIAGDDLVTPTRNDLTVSAATNEGTLNAASHTFTENGSFEFTATDEAGNITSKIVKITNIDKVAPVTSHEIAINHTTKHVTISLSSTDYGSDTVTTYYRMDDIQYSGNEILLNKQGTYIITYWSVDAVGNEETSITIDVKVEILQMDSEGQFDIEDIVSLFIHGTIEQQDMNGDGVMNIEDIRIMLGTITPIYPIRD
jgi:hypothetical protein